VGVDNILNKLLDPLFIGYTHLEGLECSMKTIQKKSYSEAMGVLVQNDEKLEVVEYTQLRDEKELS